MASAVWSNISLDVAVKHSADMINTNNQLTLSKRYYSQSCGWASPNQMKALTEKTGVPWRRNPAWVSSLPGSPTDFRLASPHDHVGRSFKIQHLGLYLLSHITYWSVSVFLWRTPNDTLCLYLYKLCNTICILCNLLNLQFLHCNMEKFSVSTLIEMFGRLNKIIHVKFLVLYLAHNKYLTKVRCHGTTVIIRNKY